MPWVENASPEVDEISQWRLIFGVCFSLSVLMIAVVSTRLWIRYKARGLAADDIMAALSMLFAIIYSVLCIVRTLLSHQRQKAQHGNETLTVHRDQVRPRPPRQAAP